MLSLRRRFAIPMPPFPFMLSLLTWLWVWQIMVLSESDIDIVIGWSWRPVLPYLKAFSIIAMNSSGGTCMLLVSAAGNVALTGTSPRRISINVT